MTRQTAPGFPRLSKPEATKPWDCPKDDPLCTKVTPCNSCRGRRSTQSGRRRQHQARRMLERLTGTLATRFLTQAQNEERWRLPIRVEVKSGKQTDPIWSKYAAAEAQSNAAKAAGDSRAFVFVAMGSRTSDGLFVCRLSALDRVVEALVNELAE